MNSLKILSEDIKELRIASLPNRPNADEGFGGVGLSPEEMKAAFDKLPLYIIERFNTLIDVLFEGGSDLASSIKSGLGSDHTLRDLLNDMGSGLFASYVSTGSVSLNARLISLEKRISELEGGGGFDSGV